ncbi:MAG TPA: hypothetical protein DHV98_06530, partial [Flavobacteriaceae bacterium]|nr:hypothetical protein [Flavobacteriaceae bacterium]
MKYLKMKETIQQAFRMGASNKITNHKTNTQTRTATSKKLTDMIIYKFKTVENAFWVFLATISIIGCADNGEYITISSPSETNTLKLTVDEGQLFYRVNHGNKKVVALSQLGFKFKNGQSLLDDFEVVAVDFDDVDETWEQTWGEEKLIRNNYRAC